MTLNVRLSAVSSLLFAVNFAMGQSSTPTHQHAPTKIIDGSVHPELISDIDAYRLYFVMVSQSPEPSDVQAKRQSAQVGKVGLAAPDALAFKSSLAAFHSQYAQLIREYNEAATAAWANGERSDPTLFKLRRDRLVQSVRESLKASLSEDGWKRLDQFVQGEKRRMKSSAAEGAQ